MQIARLTDEMLPQAQKLFNEMAESVLVYKRLDDIEFYHQFIEESNAVSKMNLTAIAQGKLVGFANASYNANSNKGYITFVAVDNENKRQGIGRTLLKELETELYNRSNSTLEKIEITFFNPTNLEWCVPNTKRQDHPNAPGVDVACDGYLFLKNCGYRDVAYQNSFYQPLKDFEFSQKIKERLESLKSQDIVIAYYDEKIHTELNELFTDLQNEAWHEIIMKNVGLADAEPVLIAQHKDRVVGFTGPLHVQKSGRGYFAGIGVHSEYRKYGLGKALFSSLCMALKDMGADYMTLFTGETNPARNIYEAAGFKIVKTWANMEKPINTEKSGGLKLYELQ